MTIVKVPLAVKELSELIALLETVEAESRAPGFCAEMVLHLIQCLHDHYYKGVVEL